MCNHCGAANLTKIYEKKFCCHMINWSKMEARSANYITVSQNSSTTYSRKKRWTRVTKSCKKDESNNNNITFDSVQNSIFDNAKINSNKRTSENSIELLSQISLPSIKADETKYLCRVKNFNNTNNNDTTVDIRYNCPMCRDRRCLHSICRTNYSNRNVLLLLNSISNSFSSNYRNNVSYNKCIKYEICCSSQKLRPNENNLIAKCPASSFNINLLVYFREEMQPKFNRFLLMTTMQLNQMDNRDSPVLDHRIGNIPELNMIKTTTATARSEAGNEEDFSKSQSTKTIQSEVKQRSRENKSSYKKQSKNFTNIPRTFNNKLSSNYLLLLVLYLCATTVHVMGAFRTDLSVRDFRNGPGIDRSDICPSMDIRNTPKAFANFTRCRVVEGFLMISLMDKFTSADYENLTFPLLTEITDYLLVYRINGLQSLGKLFPNLSVIRGNALFEGYSLIVYENMHLEEIALKSLTYIKRGAVRIEKNPLLCFAETIDWTKIAVNATLDHFLSENKMQNECPVCPGGAGKYKDKSERTDVLFETPDNLEACPLSQGSLRICWNRQNCQRVCPDHCGNRACNEKGKCCDESCIGGCAVDDVKKCSACRYFTMSNNTCVQTCPPNYYKYMGRRCVTFNQCREIRKPLNTETNEEYPFIPFKDVCSTSCPPNYEKVSNGTCRLCEGKCIKKCDGGTIDSLKSAEKLRGCTIVTGSLLISIRQGGSHVIEELERSLSSIEEIEGFLKIARSYSIVSLSFLRGLRVIKGQYALDANKYALYVLDNQNLQSLFNENQTVIIERGKIFFHFNPLLCYYKIKELQPYIRENDTFDKADVAEDSNGDRIACQVQPLKANITKVGSKAAVVSVTPIEFEDERVFLGYQYYYVEAPHQNISIYDSRDGCGNDAWNVDDDTSKDTFHLFSHLKPYTQYAYYVKTYTIAAERTGGQSPIQYFRTEPDKPEPVRNLRSYPNGSSEIVINWEAPKIANGNLTTYVIRAFLTYDDNKLLEQRNYCTEPIKEHKLVTPLIPDITKPDAPEDKEEKMCSCDGISYRPGGRPIEESEVENIIEFEDAIQNFVYIKREERNDDRPLDRRRRDLIEEHFTQEPPTNSDQTDSVFPSSDRQSNGPAKSNPDDDTVPKKDRDGDYFTYFYAAVNVSTKIYVLRDLKHYSSYTIAVKACREGLGDNCSRELIITGRTLKIDGADDIISLTAVVETTNATKSTVRLNWKPPEHPNSMIVSYNIKYQRVDIEHSKTWEKCITQREYMNLSGYTLSELETGNYSVQVMATSLAGDGNFTTAIYFYIPEIRMSPHVIAGISIAVIILVSGLVTLIYCIIRKKFLPPTPDLKLFTSVNPEYISMQYKPDEWEIERDQIIQLRELGQGSFGMVYEGIVKRKDGIDTPCAIKTVNESATDRERINFLNEASVMKAFDTYHVVRLLGVVSRGQPTLVIMELMTNGDLKGYLRSHRPDSESVRAGDPPPQPPTLKRILQMAIEIADGMAYLSAKKFVHRDLAARNCMVAENLTVKIGDFGMTRDIYETDYYRKGTKGLLPVRWMAPESLKDGVFTSSSDVFSYGVVLWEMATLASQPYQGLSNDQVLRYVIDGGVMERPENCPDKLYNMMRKCWLHRPSSRPSFMEIIQSLLDDADSDFRRVSFYHSDEGQEIIEQMHPVTDIDDVTTPLRMEDDEFKIDVDDNFLMDRTDSQLVQEQHPNSPYSFGSAVITSNSSSIPGGALKPCNQNSPSVSKNLKNSLTAAVQNRSYNSIVAPRFLGMEFLRNAFLGSGNNSNSNSCSNSTEPHNGNCGSRENVNKNGCETYPENFAGGIGSGGFGESARNFFNGFKLKNVNTSSSNNVGCVANIGGDNTRTKDVPSTQQMTSSKDYQKLNQLNDLVDVRTKLKSKSRFKMKPPFKPHTTIAHPNYGILKPLTSSSLPLIKRTQDHCNEIGYCRVNANTNVSSNITDKQQFVPPTTIQQNNLISKEQYEMKNDCMSEYDKVEQQPQVNGFVIFNMPRSDDSLQKQQRLHESKNVECIH